MVVPQNAPFDQGWSLRKAGEPSIRRSLCKGAVKQRIHPAPSVLARARFSKTAKTRGRHVWISLWAHVTHTMEHMLQTPTHHHKMVPSSQAYTKTQEQMELQLHLHFDTQVLQPSQSCKALFFLIIGTARTMVPRLWKHRVAVLGPWQAINRRWSLPSRINLASSTVLQVSTRRSRDTHCPGCPAKRQ